MNNWIVYVGIGCLVSFLIIRYIRYGFFIMLLFIGILTFTLYQYLALPLFVRMVLYGLIPYLFYNMVLYVYLDKEESETKGNKVYRAIFKTQNSKIVLDNIRRGVSIIGSAGSGKTESVVYNFLKHF
ncbi:MAG: type IV secretory system conjugative DNA transfer family protein, partial [Flavobacteriaceae bacterium]|nr:type IV secretory system conjugative DNA transfer family protein [Flavobacteriaceae bacterium]